MSIKARTRKVLQDIVALNSRNWNFLAWCLGMIGSLSRFSGNVLFKKLYIRVLKVSDDRNHHTQSWVIPISAGINFNLKTEQVVLPVDLVRKAIRESTYRAIMHKCICRTGKKCKNHPVDFGCIFLGESARVLVKNKAGRESSVEEALEHLDKAASLGLICMCLWVEAEGFPLGIRPEDHHKFLEICFCCPCCCIAFRNFVHMPGEVTRRFKSIGWTACEVSECSLCKKCVKVCPVKARYLEDDSVRVDGNCIGCGLCAVQCPQKAIIMRQIAEMKDDIKDYFEGLSLDL